MTEWEHAVVDNPRVSTVEKWEYWPDPEWRWHVAHSAPREPRHELEKIVNERSPQEEYWTWSVSFQGSEPERWHGSDEWLVGGVCFSEAEAKETCDARVALADTPILVRCSRGKLRFSPGRSVPQGHLFAPR